MLICTVYNAIFILLHILGLFRTFLIFSFFYLTLLLDVYYINGIKVYILIRRAGYNATSLSSITLERMRMIASPSQREMMLPLPLMLSLNSKAISTAKYDAMLQSMMESSEFM
jgi:hypothetical protein